MSKGKYFPVFRLRFSSPFPFHSITLHFFLSFLQLCCFVRRICLSSSYVTCSGYCDCFAFTFLRFLLFSLLLAFTGLSLFISMRVFVTVSVCSRSSFVLGRPTKGFARPRRDRQRQQFVENRGKRVVPRRLTSVVAALLASVRTRCFSL